MLRLRADQGWGPRRGRTVFSVDNGNLFANHCTHARRALFARPLTSVTKAVYAVFVSRTCRKA